MGSSRFITESIAMSASGRMFVGRRFQCASTRERKPRILAQKRRTTIPRIEALEAIALLSTGSPVISGFVFLDENPTNPNLTNNGLFDPGEAAIGGASVQLYDSSNHLLTTQL